jgi:uncharacterized protein YceK
MKSKLPLHVAVLAVAVLVGGCASYYKVTDPASGRVYYTQEVERKGGTTVMFKDGKTGAQVTLPSSEVMEVKSDEYKKNTAPPPAK